MPVRWLSPDAIPDERRTEPYDQTFPESYDHSFLTACRPRRRARQVPSRAPPTSRSPISGRMVGLRRNAAGMSDIGALILPSTDPVSSEVSSIQAAAPRSEWPTYRPSASAAPHARCPTRRRSRLSQRVRWYSLLLPYLRFIHRGTCQPSPPPEASQTPC
jgi:hypothetical protein